MYFKVLVNKAEKIVNVSGIEKNFQINVKNHRGTRKNDKVCVEKVVSHIDYIDVWKNVKNIPENIVFLNFYYFEVWIENYLVFRMVENINEVDPT